MHISYDYTDLLEELLDDIKEGLIEQDGDLLIVRSEQAIADEKGPYYPIIDYYSVDFEQEVTQEIRELGEDPEITYNQELSSLLKADRKLLRAYNKDKKSGRLERKDVNEVIVEMGDWNRIIR